MARAHGGSPGCGPSHAPGLPRLGAQRIEFINDDRAVRSRSSSAGSSCDLDARSSPGCSPTQPYQEE
eukprot:11463809-Alexandrium_andersonii.AAC.1